MMITFTHLTLYMIEDMVPLHMMTLGNLAESGIATCLVISVDTHATLYGHTKNVLYATTTDHAVLLVEKFGCVLMLLMITRPTTD